MGWTCTCGDGELPDSACRVHGLAEGQNFPPMDRHALYGEDARSAQVRLYEQSMGLREQTPVERFCRRCGAQPGRPCRTRSGAEVRGTHHGR